jgi:hypothetical protein
LGKNSYFGSFEESDEVVEFVRVRSEPKDLHFFQSCETLVTTQLVSLSVEKSLWFFFFFFFFFFHVHRRQEILCEGKIEDSSVVSISRCCCCICFDWMKQNDEGWCEVDFANKQLGGGVLGKRIMLL